MNLTQLVFCVWDGGLKTFAINSRLVMQDYLSWGSIRWRVANKILKTYDENEEQGLTNNQPHDIIKTDKRKGSMRNENVFIRNVDNVCSNESGSMDCRLH